MALQHPARTALDEMGFAAASGVPSNSAHAAERAHDAVPKARRGHRPGSPDGYQALRAGLDAEPTFPIALGAANVGALVVLIERPVGVAKARWTVRRCLREADPSDIPSRVATTPKPAAPQHSKKRAVAALAQLEDSVACEPARPPAVIAAVLAGRTVARLTHDQPPTRPTTACRTPGRASFVRRNPAWGRSCAVPSSSPSARCCVVPCGRRTRR